MTESATKRYGIVLVDVDATLAQYDGTFVEGEIGPPLPGAVEAITKIREKRYVVIFTTRPLKDVQAWAAQHHLEYDGYVQKPTLGPVDARMWCVVDDRAIQFNGDWIETARQLDTFEPWYRR